MSDDELTWPMYEDLPKNESTWEELAQSNKRLRAQNKALRAYMVSIMQAGSLSTAKDIAERALKEQP